MINENLKNLSKKDLVKLLAIIILSDGTISKCGKYSKSLKLDTIYYNDCQHDFYDYLCKNIFNKKANRCRYKVNNTKILSSRLYGVIYIKELLKLSPSYKTTPGPKFSKKEFLVSSQPTIKFILNSKSKKLKKLALRTYFDFDGSVIPSFKMKYKKDIRKGKIYPYYQIQFQCDINIAETNPNLVEEILSLCKMLNLKAIVVKDRRKWSGINGIRVTELNSVKKFIKFGGPITGVKISSKSKRFFGITKDAVCRGVIRILNKNIPLSYYFKNYEEALRKKEELNKMLISEIKNIN